ncbi:SDR family NAD(P)-dependent oxidoreductase [Persicimonas caeni]|uniref:SDR family NAD(P)-dependent oxidoreductase n=1 Tax=Persicimonas caeni TaxID=2292766 RepID=A0A4Y6PR47_PERCE|nr:SDR family NAD(P)-dependent oxidoreductase [Persicimonas caeni]QDG50255.1 SDR family NAD(P)-dependent oxidoreductase [Persicimonas caeni]QED31476.1 SDR family NAD(P)-dependent oxidoreductase [Persicimonas caeni]
MPNERKFILVTGANRGVGLATVAALLDERDDTHVFLGSRSLERGEEARDKVLADQSDADQSDADKRVEVVQIDVSDDASVQQAAETVAERLGDAPLYGLVNNAGIGDRDRSMRTVLDVNTRGPHRVCEAFLPLLTHDDARIVNVASASGPNFVSGCSPERQAQLTDPEITWDEIEEIMDEAIAIDEGDGDFEAAGFGGGSAYGLSKACLNAYTVALAREHSDLTINACTPGFIETGMTRPMAERQGVSPAEMGMKPPEEGTTAQMFLLFGEPGGSGWYFGSDAERSPLDRYRSPGDPPYTGE